MPFMVILLQVTLNLYVGPVSLDKKELKKWQVSPPSCPSSKYIIIRDIVIKVFRKICETLTYGFSQVSVRKIISGLTWSATC